MHTVQYMYSTVPSAPKSADQPESRKSPQNQPPMTESATRMMPAVMGDEAAGPRGSGLPHRPGIVGALRRPRPCGSHCITRAFALGHPDLAAKAEDKEQLSDAKRFASAARGSLLDVRGVAGPPARGGGLRSFPGGATPANCCQRRPQGDRNNLTRWQPPISIEIC